MTQRTMKKGINNSTDVREGTSAKLRNEHRELHSLIYIFLRDIQILERGVIIK